MGDEFLVRSCTVRVPVKHIIRGEMRHRSVPVVVRLHSIRVEQTRVETLSACRRDKRTEWRASIVHRTGRLRSEGVKGGTKWIGRPCGGYAGEHIKEPIADWVVSSDCELGMASAICHAVQVLISFTRISSPSLDKL